MARPLLFVLAGVNGAGKSTAGERELTQAGLVWFNPDTFTRKLMEASGASLEDANAMAWQQGVRQLDTALTNGTDYAFETTLGGNTIARKLREANKTHDVLMWFTGLDSPEHHIARVQQRVARGGHDIPAAKIRERFESSRKNLIVLLPHLTQLQVYDNSTDAILGQPMPNPRLLLQLEHGRITYPNDIDTLKHTPDWAKPILMAALSRLP
ncbi:MAG TPA: AAA family ATPase [Thermomonas sp.]|jgi:predicted ABC-type ATPase|uniref:AAA family ATPase n=1 Tax=Thermomonas sp. TaxID=1971895 RepID=UPI002CFFC6F9|nr:AAA family ATPase [Thermomonas sp.]HOV96705.1 AAA family ATPase [Thermomonas sp.]